MYLRTLAGVTSSGRSSRTVGLALGLISRAFTLSASTHSRSERPRPVLVRDTSNCCFPFLVRTATE